MTATAEITPCPDCGTMSSEDYDDAGLCFPCWDRRHQAVPKADVATLESEPRVAEPEDTAGLLEAVREFVTRYIVFTTKAQETAVALWIAHAHAVEAADVTPYLQVVSAEKRSGKSRLLEVLKAVVPRGIHTPNISEAALYRIIETVKPTLLIDEVDALFSSGAERMEALRGVINAGNRRGTPVYRCEGPKSEVREFDVFGAKVVAGIDNGALPDTIRDRSIPVRLRRKTPGDRVERLLWNDVAVEARVLQERAEAWGFGVVNQLTLARPDLPAALDDRAAESWWPLLAIADHAGNGWPALARAAAVELSTGTATDEESRGVRLLSDVRAVFGERLAMSTEAILIELNGLEEAPWGAWHNGGGMAPRDLARLLKPYEVRSQTVRTGDSTAKGYHRGHGLEDAWARYLPQEGSHPSHASQPASRLERDVTDVTDVTHIGEQEGQAAGLADLDRAERLLVDHADLNGRAAA